ncbi:MAG: hypothetical protein ACLRRH_09870 [Clostridium sp.]
MSMLTILIFMLSMIFIFAIPINLIRMIISLIKKDKEKAMRFFILFIIGIIAIKVFQKITIMEGY